MKKKILYGIVAMMCATIGGVKAYDGLTKNNMSALMVVNVEALTKADTDWSKLKLKVVTCTCPTTGKKGDTLKCEEDGTLESCSTIQQGSKACYKIGLLNITLC